MTKLLNYLSMAVIFQDFKIHNYFSRRKNLHFYVNQKHEKKVTQSNIFDCQSRYGAVHTSRHVYRQRDRATYNGFVTHFLSMSVQYH